MNDRTLNAWSLHYHYKGKSVRLAHKEANILRYLNGFEPDTNELASAIGVSKYSLKVHVCTLKRRLEKVDDSIEINYCGDQYILNKSIKIKQWIENG